MKIKKQIKEHFNSVQLPSADTVLPEAALINKQPKTSTRWVPKLVTVILCVCAIAISLIVGLNRSLEPSPTVNISDIVSKDENSDLSEENSNFGGSESIKTDESDDCTSGEPDIYEQPDTSEDPAVSKEPDVSENSDISEEPADPEPNEPEVVTVYGTVGAGEFAGDMYRPDGYDEKIGSVLAIMMSMNKEEETKFNVLVHTYDNIDLKDLLLQTVGAAEVITVEINGEFVGSAYYVSITDTQIKELTGYGLNCYYIGSGLGDYRDMNWETEEGIRTYCEIWGDMYTFNNRGVSLEPDIYIED